MGTPDFAVPALMALIKSPNHDVIAVYTREPKPKGRGMDVQKSAVHHIADTYNIDVHTPKSLRKSIEEQEIFAAYHADAAVVAAYGLLLPKAVLEAPKYGCFNIHGSLLPRWRGASPIQHAIWKGDDVSGNHYHANGRGHGYGRYDFKNGNTNHARNNGSITF